ncbi:amino acid adenylation domain-containing protein [Streptomyces sp. Wb2n-11]|uniref:non-ribosomal peptide synthetase n=1 Tax=Streptomyces sp. Wb2n-11 TaxID=1030533 RepID=UPI000AFF4113|nr:non-ribosomal peptide synthetase [Streptomyces sp. Wb2n-11]
MLLAAYAAVLARWTAWPRVAVGLPAHGPGPAVLGVGTAPSVPFAELVRQTHVLLGRAPERTATGTPEAGAGFVVDTAPDVPPAPYGEICLRVVVEHGEPVRLDAAYDAALFTARTVRRLLGHYRTLLEGAVADPGLPLGRLPLLTEPELRTMLVDWNDTAVRLPLHDGTLHGAFARQAARHPDRTAVVTEDRRVTYAEADRAANRLAHRLRALGVRNEARVGLLLDRSPEFLVSALAVMKAGGAFVPLDPGYPAERLRTMLADARCHALVIRDGPVGVTGLPAERVVRLGTGTSGDTGTDTDTAAPEGPPEGHVGGNDLCYIIFTSGSTGRPKGIALRHAGVLNNLLDINTRYQVGPGDSVLALSSLGFDMSVYEFLGSTVSGATVVLPDPARHKDPSHWADLVRRHRVTVWNSAPSLFELLITHAERARDTDLSSLRLSLSGGDWIPVSLPDRVRVHAPDLRFIALGGATEASIHSTVHEVSHGERHRTSIPYGRPMANQRTYVLDAERRPVPVNVAGELYLAGDGLARGYIGDEQLTADRFTVWSHGPVSGERLYRTGDLARYDDAGRLELLGRIDLQVKIRGVRVETGEVEAAVARHPAVKSCVVAARGAADRDRSLVAYAVAHPGSRVTGQELREHTAGLLPSAMVPAQVVLLDALPLTPNGKVDRAALPAVPRTGGGAEGGAAGPDDPWERRVADAWHAVLDAEHGPDDDFFTVGGDSLAAMRIVQLIDPHLPVAELFDHPSVHRLAGRLRALDGER